MSSPWTPAKFDVGKSSCEKMRVWGYFENVFLKVRSFDLGENIRLRPILETERRQLYAWDGRVPDQGIPLESIDGLSTVAETTVMMNWPQVFSPYVAASGVISTIQSICELYAYSSTKLSK